MGKKLDRRGAAKAVAAVGGLFALGGAASAAGGQPAAAAAGWAGEWFHGGKVDQPCAIFQHGRVLLLVNERGDLASAVLTAEDKVSVQQGWEQGYTGAIGDRGKTIVWKDGAEWKRR
ncbi:MAG: hypothetical protein C0501_13250 [Isosphaera sp.]|nr:hypothetical protein [Isosphaera sp.]